MQGFQILVWYFAMKYDLLFCIPMLEFGEEQLTEEEFMRKHTGIGLKQKGFIEELSSYLLGLSKYG